MASSIGRERDSTASPSIKDLIHGAPGSLIDGLIILAIGLSAGLYFVFSSGAREWAIETLGDGGGGAAAGRVVRVDALPP